MFKKLTFFSRYSYQPAINFTKGNQSTPVQAQTQQVPKQTYAPKVMTVRDALNMALDEELKRDDAVILLGEEVGQYQGAYKVSKGLLEKHGAAKVIDTPITEAGFAGLGVGAGLLGLKPIIEFMTFNFAMQAIDHIVNSCAKSRYMSGGDLSCQVVFRGINGAAASVGAQHSQCYASWYSQVPGLVVMAPFDCDDAKSMLKAAIRDPNPVVFLENEILYNQKFEMSAEVIDPDYAAPVGKAKIMREGKDVTIVAFSKMVQYSLDAAKELEKEGISCEVINLRTLRPLDRETIVKSVMKTNRLVAVEEGWPQCGITSEICALMMETKTFFYLDAPVQRVTGVDAPTPYAFNLEPMSFPQAFNIVNAVKKVMSGQ